MFSSTSHLRPSSGDVSKYTVDSFLKRYHLNYSTATADLKFLRSPSGLLRLDGTASQGGYTAWFEEALARPDVVRVREWWWWWGTFLLACVLWRDIGNFMRTTAESMMGWECGVYPNPNGP